MKTRSRSSRHALAASLCVLALPGVGCGIEFAVFDPTGDGMQTESAGDEAGDGTGDETGTDGVDTMGEVHIVPPPGGMRRLTPDQYVSSVEVILGSAPAAVASPPALPQLGGFDSATANTEPLTPIDIERYENSAMAIGTAVMNAPSALEARVPCVAADAQPVCYEDVIAELGRLAWRRPLTDEEAAQLLQIANAGYEWAGGDFLTGIKYLVGALLQSPHFLYVIEVGEPPDEGDLRELTPYELATRLSFFLLGRTPDDELLELAEGGQLETTEQIRALALDLLSRPAARDRLSQFYDELYRLRDLKTKGKDSLLFPTFTPELAAAMRYETLLLIQNVVFEEESNFLGIFDANYTFVNEDLARLYGISSPAYPWQLVPLPVDQGRAGILSQPAFLTVFSHPDVNSPTRRGLFVQEVLLCTDIHPPPPQVEVTAPAPTQGQTLRQWLEELHNTEPGCYTCHGQMDPIGFAFERYSPIGRFRQFDNGQPIDSSGVVGGLGRFEGAADLASLLRHDPRTPGCVVRNLYRSTLGYDEGIDQADGIAWLEQVFADSDYNYKTLMVELTLNPLFRLVDAPK